MTQAPHEHPELGNGNHVQPQGKAGQSRAKQGKAGQSALPLLQQISAGQHLLWPVSTISTL